VSIDLTIRVFANASDPGELPADSPLVSLPPFADHPLILIQVHPEPYNYQFNYAVSAPMRLMVPAGTAVGAQMNITNNSTAGQGASCNLSISGYVETAGSTSPERAML
jgi:hypothetical protein